MSPRWPCPDRPPPRRGTRGRRSSGPWPRNWRLTRRISRSPTKRTPRLSASGATAATRRGEPGAQPARAGLRVAVGVEEDDLAGSRSRLDSRRLMRPGGGSASSRGLGCGVEVEARIVDPLVEDVREHPQEGLRDQAQVGEGEVGLVELAVVQAVVDDGADQAADLGRRRLDQGAAGRLDGVGDHQHAHHLVLRLGAGIAVLLLGDVGGVGVLLLQRPCCRRT